ncbi:MAG: prevent-host-death protein [Caulobacteraceae bacterium]|jgi:prevent-host-death family protein|nr:prevent-host-death protein [Caulobacteraceae bacterium]
MRVSVSDAKGQLTELVRLAEAGDEVILTRHGQPAVRLTPIKRALAPAERRRILDEVRKAAAGTALPGESAARSQDFLYDEDGLPK